MVKERACRKCRSLASGKNCPICNSADLSSEWSGLIIINNSEKSQIARSLGVSKVGRYALKVN